MRRSLLLVVLLAAACTGTTAAPTAPTTPPVAAPAPTTNEPSVGPSRAAPATTTLARHELWVFPGPDVVAGDVLRVEVPTFGTSRPDVEELSATWDGEEVEVEPNALVDPIVGGRIALDEVVDTTGQVGLHELAVDAVVDGEPLRRTRAVRVLPDAVRDPAERTQSWTTERTACCTVHAVGRTGPARDLGAIADELDRTAAAVAARFGQEPDRDVAIALLPSPWGNGGFANPERTVLALPDRDPSPSDRTTLFVHELTHVYAGRLGDHPTALSEGLAVEAAGGHYAVSPLRPDAAALAAAGDDVPVRELFDDFAELQHERRYLQAGAFIAWLLDAHGEEALQQVLRHDPGEDDVRGADSMDRALDAAIGTGLDDAATAFATWLAATDPKAVADAGNADLVELQELRRRWQREYAPWEALFDLLGTDVTDFPTRRLTRRADDPGHVAVETMFAAAQQALFTDDEPRRADLIAALTEVVDTGAITGGIASDHLAIARTIALAGGELVELDVDGGAAVATVVDEGALVDRRLERDQTGWVLLPAAATNP